MLQITSGGGDETLELGKKLAPLLRAGDVVLLIGELGTGKTVFARGVARGLGIERNIVSPTFTLLKEYDARLPLNHLDAYRLEGPGDLYDLGIDEYLEGGILLVEWADRVYEFFDRDFLEIRIEFGEGESSRYVSLIPVGGDWVARLAEAGLKGKEHDGE
jgi:tRNA threonylcarbamoyladenosine biosynthesis protein TsaE